MLANASGCAEPAVCCASGNSRPTSTGVITMPNNVEADALQMAAGILPRAMAVKAMADCTVAGSTHKSRMPV